MLLRKVDMLNVQIALAVMLLLLCIAIGVWEILCYWSGKPEYTISTIIGYWSGEEPMLPLAVGILIGHLFWPRTPWTPPKSPLIPLSLLLIAVGVTVPPCFVWRFSLPAIRLLWISVRSMPSGFLSMITSLSPLPILLLACNALWPRRRDRESTRSCRVYRQFLRQAARRSGDG